MADFDDLFAQFDLAHLRKTLDAVGLTFGFVGTVDETMHDRQMRDAGAIVPTADGKSEIVSSPFALEGAPKVAPRPAPAMGQHTDEVLAEYGFSAAEIAQMREARAVA
jgi:formyl-CoA transferase